MPFYNQEEIEKARQVDLFTYLQACEPQELVHVSGNVYCTREHDSLRISNGKWCWFSRGIGGYSALDYLIKVKGCSFMEAMEAVIGRAAIQPPSRAPAPKEEKPKRLLLPPPAPDNRAMLQYLAGRGIDQEILDYCVKTGRVYESRNKGHGNVVFVGFDKAGKARFGCLRGIGEGRFHGDVSGSDKHYSIKTVDRGRKTIKQASSTAKGTVKTASKSIKTAEKTAKASIKTTRQAAKAAQRTAQATARAARAAAHAARAAARAAVVAAKVAAKATIAAVKAIIAATKALIAAIAAGGWIAVLVIVIICLIGLLIGSCFGIFFSGEDSGSGYTMQNVVQEINDDYQQQIDTTKANLSHDVLEMSGSRAVWPEVLAVYAVKTTTDPDNPQEVATMDDSKKAILTDIFWEMNQISSRTETRTETVITETDDGNGNIVETETTVTQTYLYITVSHKTAEEMAAQYGFDEEQKEQLAELLAEENRSLWSAVLYGIYTEDGAIVSVALSQVGNVGGEPYWSWYGFDSRVEWCACFVSWCANECGYIDTGVIPKYAGCVNGVQWFKDRGQWMDGSAEPAPGMIIFFDWDDENGQDGLSDHTGIVEKVENGRVYTIEGNSGDSVRQNSYPVGYYEVLGYGCPDF